MTNLRSPVRYPGGKGLNFSKILNAFPNPYTDLTYVEPFGGGASVLFKKDQSDLEIYNDIDSGIYALFSVLADPDKFQRFYFHAQLTPYSREFYEHCRDTYKDAKTEEELAYKFFVFLRQSYASSLNGKSGWSNSKSSFVCVSRWLSAIDLLPEIHARLMSVQIEHMDGLKCIRSYDSENTLFYIDPPYYGIELYNHNYSEQNHKDLIELLLTVKGYVVLSGYDNPVYKKLLDAGWDIVSFETTSGANTYNNSKSRQRVECLWLNY